MKEKQELIRVDRNNEGMVQIDFSGKKAGRGAYVCKDFECIQRSIKTKGLERSFKTSVPKQIYEELLKEFEQH